MTSFQPCERCGTALPRDSTAGLCPVCLVRLVTGEEQSAGETRPSEEARTSVAPRVGSRVGDYVLEAPLGEGGMGIVYRARQSSLNRVVAIKMLPFGRFSPDAHLKRFRAEAEAIAQLRHPNIVTIYEVGEHEGQPFFSMEYVDGPDLAKMIRERPPPIREAARLLARVAQAIHYAHEQGIVHRDLKPSNILLDSRDQPLVSDFGLVRNLASDSDLTITGQALGSPHYLPPEQAEGRREAHTPASDVYGLGAILFHLLTGRPPFVGETIGALFRQLAESEPVFPRLLNPDVPRDLEIICLKCLEKDPARRYRSAKELADELERFLRDEPIRARPINPFERAWRWCRRRPALAGMTAATLLTLCAGLITSLTLWHREQERARQLSESLVRVELQRVEDLFERGESPEALAHLALLLSSHQTNLVAAQRIVSALTHRNFLLPASHEFEDVHEGRLSTLAITADRLASATEGGQKLVVWDTSNGLKATVELVLSSPVRLTAISRDGNRVAVALHDSTIQFWTLGDSPKLAAIARLSGPAAEIQFNPLGTCLLALVQNQGVELLDTDTGNVLHTLPGSHFAAFSANGLWLVTVTNTEAVIRDAQTGEPRGRPIRHPYRIETARFSPDSTRLLTASADGSARAWEVPSGGRVGRPLFHGEQVLNAVFSPDGQRILTQTLSSQGQLWDALSGLPLSSSFPLSLRLDPALFSPDGLWLVSHYQNRVWLRDAFSGQAVSEPVRLSGVASLVRFLPDGRRFVTTESGGHARLWSVLPGDAPPLALQHAMELVWAGFSPDGSRILTCSKDRSARVWSAAGGRPMIGPLPHEQRRLTCGAFDAAGERVATADFDGRVRIWDSTSGRQLADLLQHNGEVTAVAFSRNGQWLVSASVDGTARFWNASDGTAGPVFRHAGSVRAILFSADSTRLVTGGDDRAVRVRNLANGEQTAELKHGGAVNCLALTPDGRTLVAGDRTGHVRFWNVSTGGESGAPLLHAGPVLSVRFNRDGTQLVTASSDQTARVWDAQTHRAVSRPLSHRDAVVTASFSPDGRYVLTGSWDHTARVWDMATGHPVCDSLPHGNLVVSAEWSPDGRAVLTASWDGSARVWAMPFLSRTPQSRWLADLAGALGGLKIRNDGLRLEITSDRSDMPKIGLPEDTNGDPHFVEWAQWLLADRQTRTIAPQSTHTTAEYTRARLDDTRADRLREKLRFTPMNGEGLARWSRLVLKQDVERNPRRLAEATFAAELAARLNPDSHEPWWSLAEVKLSAGQREGARDAFRQASARLPKVLRAKERAELDSLIDRLGNDDAPITTPKE
ncbi:MAG: protein kinase [Verrucomicrobiota bacterium]